MAKIKLIKNKIYYSKYNNWKLRFIEIDLEQYAIFKVIEHNDKKIDWEEYWTKNYLDEIVKTKKELKD